MPLAELVREAMGRFPTSGEINRRVGDARAVLARIRAAYTDRALRVDETDGVSMEFPSFRFNLRTSNTEPLIRLNVETRGDRRLLDEKTGELLAAIGGEA